MSSLSDNFRKKMKIFFLVRGLGEYAQAYPVALSLLKRKERVLIFTDYPFVYEIACADDFEVFLIEDPQKMKEKIEDLEGEALFLCNSHTTYKFKLSRPKKIKKIFSLDSNWLFNNQLYPIKTYPWIDCCYVVFPKRYFLANLKENGGHFVIDSFFKKKIKTLGFLPVGRKLSLEEKKQVREKYQAEDKKLITYYQSSPKIFKDDRFLPFKLRLVEDLKKILTEIKEQYQTSIVFINLVSEAEKIGINKTERFNELISSSDLMIMHQGYGTLPKLFHNQVPIISFTERPENNLFGAYFELLPAIKFGILKHFFYNYYPKETLKKTIIELLFDKQKINQIKENQKNIFENGEKKIINDFYSYFKR